MYRIKKIVNRVDLRCVCVYVYIYKLQNLCPEKRKYVQWFSKYTLEINYMLGYLK